MTHHHIPVDRVQITLFIIKQKEIVSTNATKENTLIGKVDNAIASAHYL